MNHRQQLFRGSFAIVLLVTKFGQLTRSYPGYMRLRVDHQDAVVINYLVMENGFWLLEALLGFRENLGRSHLKEGVPYCIGEDLSQVDDLMKKMGIIGCGGY